MARSIFLRLVVVCFFGGKKTKERKSKTEKGESPLPYVGIFDGKLFWWVKNLCHVTHYVTLFFLCFCFFCCLFLCFFVCVRCWALKATLSFFFFLSAYVNLCTINYKRKKGKKHQLFDLQENKSSLCLQCTIIKKSFLCCRIPRREEKAILFWVSCVL